MKTTFNQFPAWKEKTQDDRDDRIKKFNERMKNKRILDSWVWTIMRRVRKYE